MPRSIRILLGVVAAILLTMATPAQAQSTAEATEAMVSFSNDIAPILLKSCRACHDDDDVNGGYRVSSYEAVMKPGDSELPPASPGDLEESYLYELITLDDPDSRMPQEADPLPAEEISLVRRWIEQGAKFDGPDPAASLVSIVPKAAHPDPPEIYSTPMPVTAVAFNIDGSELAVSGYREITIWSTDDGRLLRRIKNVAERTYGLDYSPDGAVLAAASGIPGELGEVKLFDATSGELIKTLGTMSDAAFDVEFSPDGTRLAACAADRSIRLYDVASGAEQYLIEDHADWVLDVAFSDDGARLASASRDKTAKVFDAATGESQITYPDHGEPIYGVAFAPGGEQVLTAGRDEKVHIWNPADGKKVRELGGFGDEVYEICVGADRLFACSAVGKARQYDLAEYKHVRDLEATADALFAIDYHAASQRVAAGSFSGSVRIWNVEDGSLVIEFVAAPGHAPAAVEQ